MYFYTKYAPFLFPLLAAKSFCLSLQGLCSQVFSHLGIFLSFSINEFKCVNEQVQLHHSCPLSGEGFSGSGPGPNEVHNQGQLTNQSPLVELIHHLRDLRVKTLKLISVHLVKLSQAYKADPEVKIPVEPCKEES